MIDLTKLSDGTTFEELLMISDAQILKTKTGKPYLACSFGNKYGKLPARLWTLIPGAGAPATGNIFKVSGTITTFADQKQINITSMLPCDGEIPLDDFIVSVPDRISDDCFNGVIQDVIDLTVKYHSEHLQALVMHIMSKYKKQFHEATAARGVHHAGVGGLMKHTCEVVWYAQAILGNLPERTAQLVRGDLVVIGALLHDIGKCTAYTFINGMPDMSEVGKLNEHIIEGIKILHDAFLVVNADYAESGDADAQFMLYRDVQMLEHIIASHHGELEYGSPVTPVTIEALIVAHADLLSADLDCVTNAACAAHEMHQTWTDKIFTQHNRQFYIIPKWPPRG